MRARVCVHVCMYVGMYTWVRARMHACARVRVYAHTATVRQAPDTVWYARGEEHVKQLQNSVDHIAKALENTVRVCARLGIIVVSWRAFCVSVACDWARAAGRAVRPQRGRWRIVEALE